jgi:hypothetical protein
VLTLNDQVLDPGGRGLVVAHDTLSYHNNHLCIPLITNKVMDRTQSVTDGQTDGAYFYIPLFFEKAGDNKQVILSN